MSSDVVRYVHQHPPRCISELHPQPSELMRPSVCLRPNHSIYHCSDWDADTAFFTVACPCGERAVHLLGYYVADGRDEDRAITGPLFLACHGCGLVSQLFDSRKHGYDGEQGVNTYIAGEGDPEIIACPKCGEMPLIVHPRFTYQDAASYNDEMHERLEDYFNTFGVVGECTGCHNIIEIAWFECA